MEPEFLSSCIERRAWTNPTYSWIMDSTGAFILNHLVLTAFFHLSKQILLFPFWHKSKLLTPILSLSSDLLKKDHNSKAVFSKSWINFSWLPVSAHVTPSGITQNLSKSFEITKFSQKTLIRQYSKQCDDVNSENRRKTSIALLSLYFFARLPRHLGFIIHATRPQDIRQQSNLPISLLHVLN